VASLQVEADFLFERDLIPGPVDVLEWSEPMPLRVAQDLTQKESV
jgi:hypothetical protein